MRQAKNLTEVDVLVISLQTETYIEVRKDHSICKTFVKPSFPFLLFSSCKTYNNKVIMHFQDHLRF